MFKKLLQKAKDAFRKLKEKIARRALEKLAKKVFGDEKVADILEKIKVIVSVPEIANLLDKLLDLLEKKAAKTANKIDDKALEVVRKVLDIPDND